MGSKAKDRFLENKADVERILEIHQKLGGAARGRRFGLEVLNKSAVIVITACWEAYVEDVAREAFDHMLNHCSDASTFPSKVRALAGKVLREAKDERRIWALAGDGWKTVLVEYRDRMMSRFHAPNKENVDELVFDMLDLKDVSASWRWRRMSSKDAVRKLNTYVEMRGKVAHRVAYTTPISKANVRDYLGHVELLVEKTDRAVYEHVRKRTGLQPWPGDTPF